jgi:hypothetical protein
MSRYKRMKLRHQKPFDPRIGMLMDDLAELGVDHAADLAYRTSVAQFDPIIQVPKIEPAFDLLDALDAMDIPVWIGGGLGVDFQLGRVLRDHVDVDLFLLDQDGDAFERLRRLDGIAAVSQDPGSQVSQHYVFEYLGQLTIDLALVVEQGERCAVWGGMFEFSRGGFEERKRSLHFQDRTTRARTMTPELQYLLKVAGLRGFVNDLRSKDLADLRALLPLLNMERLAETKAGWKEGVPVESPARAD